MSGDLPPSSSDTRFMLPAEAAMIFCPVGAAGKGDLVDARVLGQRRAGGLAEARHDVDHARRNAGLHAELGQAQR